MTITAMAQWECDGCPTTVLVPHTETPPHWHYLVLVTHRRPPTQIQVVLCPWCMEPERRQHTVNAILEAALDVGPRPLIRPTSIEAISDDTWTGRTTDGRTVGISYRDGTMVVEVRRADVGADLGGWDTVLSAQLEDPPGATALMVRDVCRLLAARGLLEAGVA